jgi:hypothetical protein
LHSHCSFVAIGVAARRCGLDFPLIFQVKNFHPEVFRAGFLGSGIQFPDFDQSSAAFFFGPESGFDLKITRLDLLLG